MVYFWIGTLVYFSVEPNRSLKKTLFGVSGQGTKKSSLHTS